jgi:TatD DNase family protein
VRSRGAENAVIERLQAANATGILHWYPGPVQLIDRALSAGLDFSINPAMLRSQNGRRIIAAIPRERTLTETDGPYTRIQSRIAEPKDIPWVVQQIAHWWRESAADVRDRTLSNMTALFSAVARREPAQRDATGPGPLGR